MPVSMDRNFVPPIGALSLFRTRDNPWDTNLADHIWHHSLYAPHESAETMWGGQKRHDLQCLLLSSWKQVWLKILLQGSPWDIMSVLTCQQRPKVDMEPTDSAHCLFFQPWSGHKFHPQLILSSCGGKKSKKTPGRKFQPSTKFWIDTVSSPLMSMQVLSLLTLQLPIPLFSFRRALRGGQHGMKLLLHRACVGLAF